MALLGLFRQSSSWAALVKAGALLSTTSLALGVHSSAQAVCLGFAGTCAPAAWTVFVERNSSVDFAGAPGSVLLTSSDDDPGSGPFRATMELTAPVTGFVSFRYSYLTTDPGGAPATIDASSFDPFGYILNGSFIQLTPNDLAQNQVFEDSFTFTVQAGDQFGFYAESQDAASGPSLTTVSNFVYVVPGPLPVLGAAAAFGYSRRLRTRIRLRGGR